MWHYSIWLQGLYSPTLEERADREAQAGRNKEDGDKESTLQQTGKKKPWEYQTGLHGSWELFEGQDDQRAIRDKKTRQQRPSNKTITDKGKEKSTRGNNARKDKARDRDWKTTGENASFYFLKMYLTPKSKALFSF